MSIPTEMKNEDMRSTTNNHSLLKFPLNLRSNSIRENNKKFSFALWNNYVNERPYRSKAYNNNQ